MRKVLLLLALSAQLPACASEGLKPASSPAAEHPAYAAQYPEHLEQAISRFDLGRQWTDELTEKLQTYPDSLNEPDFREVRTVYELADKDGKSAHYAKSRKDNMVAAAFFVEEKDEIQNKIGGSVHYQTKKDGCDGQYYDAISRGLDKGVKERIDERTRSSSAAQVFITQHETTLGTKNVEPLQEQATEIAVVSHVVYVAMAEQHGELKAMVDQAQAIERTLKKRVSELKKTSPGERKESEIKARQDELDGLEKAQSKLKAAVEAGKQRLLTSEKEVEDARRKYEEALSSLLRKVDERAR